MKNEITIRHAEKKDAAAIHQLYSQQHIIEGTGGLPYPSLELWESRSQDWGSTHISLVAESVGIIAGQINVSVNKSFHRKHAAGIGLVVGADFLKKGVGSKLMQAGVELADLWLNVKRLELSVYSENIAAINLYKKFGFELEGTMKAYAYRHGRYVDAIRMARIRPS